MSSERQDNNHISPWWAEHIYRYMHVTSQLHANDSVLDIACGNGFGSALLAQNTKGNVWGGDLSNETIDQCTKQFNEPNLRFAVTDATQLQFADNTFDCITSFETIEHTTAYEKMVAELYRVLKPGGTLYISTPNIVVNSPDGIVRNPYHTQEFTLNELKQILSSKFSKFTLYGQHFSRYDTLNFKKRIARFTERMLYTRGIRKTPMRLQNKIMHSLIKRTQYPQPDEYVLVNEDKAVQCKTFFATCKKQSTNG